MVARSQTMLSLEEYERLPDDGRIHEFHRGELLSVSRPKPRHALLALKIFEILARYLDSNTLGKVLFDAGFLVEPDVVRGPDLAFLNAGRLAHVQPDEWFQGAPDLAIEIVSPSNTADDLLEKVTEYLNGGGHSVWVIYPRARRVEVHRPHSVQVLGMNDQLTEPDLFPGLAIPIGPLFE